MPTLKIDHLNKTFGSVRALQDMTFSVQEGEIFGFVGSNGAGKSTTMRIALGVLAKDSGEVYFDGSPINDDNRRRIGYMPEERGLYGKEPLLSQLTFLGTLHGMSKQAAQKSGTELLEQLGLGERQKDKLDDLSLGNQQRVQLAASLIHDPDMLILDEPFSGLDPVAVNVMSDMLRERAARGVPVIFSSHQLDLVQRLCDRVGIVTKGHMVAEGGVDKLRSHVASVERDDREAALADAAFHLDIEDEALSNVESQRLRAAVDEIGEPHRTAVMLAFFAGLTRAELAESTNVPIGTAKTRVRDGVQKLKLILGKEGK